MLPTFGKRSHNRTTFWKSYNEPWLNAAVQRGDRILCATSPEFRIGSLLRRNEQIKAIELSRFGQEYSYLRKYGYVYDPTTHCMVLR